MEIPISMSRMLAIQKLRAELYWLQRVATGNHWPQPPVVACGRRNLGHTEDVEVGAAGTNRSPAQVQDLPGGITWDSPQASPVMAYGRVVSSWRDDRAHSSSTPDLSDLIIIFLLIYIVTLLFYGGIIGIILFHRDSDTIFDPFFIWLVVWNIFYFPINIGLLIIPIDFHIDPAIFDPFFIGEDNMAVNSSNPSWFTIRMAWLKTAGWKHGENMWP